MAYNAYGRRTSSGGGLKALFVIGAALSSCTAMCGPFSLGDGYSDGDRTGTISKFSHKGIFNKSYEGELAMDNFKAVGDKGALSNTFAFSVTDSAIVQKIEAAQEAGVRVKLHYDQQIKHNAWATDTAYIITGVTPLGVSGPVKGFGGQ